MQGKPSRLLIATTNRGKLREILQILDGLPIEIVTLADFPDIDAPEETGQTFAENARLKARYYAAATGLPTVAEDSGLEIDALSGAPGVTSARFGGESSTYPEKFDLLYAMMQATASPVRSARFVAAIALVQPSPTNLGSSARRLDLRVSPVFPDHLLDPQDPPDLLFETRGTVDGEIAPEPRGSDGFGYDPIFFYPPFGCTLAEAGARKSTVSHRGEAFRALRNFLEQ